MEAAHHLRAACLIACLAGALLAAGGAIPCAAAAPGTPTPAAATPEPTPDPAAVALLAAKQRTLGQFEHLAGLAARARHGAFIARRAQAARQAAILASYRKEAQLAFIFTARRAHLHAIMQDPAPWAFLASHTIAPNTPADLARRAYLDALVQGNAEAAMLHLDAIKRITQRATHLGR
jgi:hypothetical protein